MALLLGLSVAPLAAQWPAPADPPSSAWRCSNAQRMIVASSSANAGSKYVSPGWPMPIKGELIGGDRDAEFARGGQDGLLHAAGDERILDLQVAHRMHRASAAQGGGSNLRQADMAT